MKLLFTHLGLKHTNTFTDSTHYLLPKAEFYIDCRCLKELCSTPEKEIANVLAKEDRTEEQFSRTFNSWALQCMQEQILCMLKTIPTRRRGHLTPYKKPITIVFMCARGCNRSPVAKTILGKRFQHDKQLIASVKELTKQDTFKVDIL